MENVKQSKTVQQMVFRNSGNSMTNIFPNEIRQCLGHETKHLAFQYLEINGFACIMLWTTYASHLTLNLYIKYWYLEVLLYQWTFKQYWDHNFEMDYLQTERSCVLWIDYALLWALITVKKIVIENIYWFNFVILFLAFFLLVNIHIKILLV